jgi:para-aminobenzoate synthetase/4-amino-4-deoxychorismate lyase
MMQQSGHHHSAIPNHRVVLYDAQAQGWLLFEQPVQVLTSHRLSDVMPLLETVERQVNQQGYYAAGFVSYEAAAAFDRSFMVHSGSAFPLVWFGLYPRSQVIFLPDLASMSSTPVESLPLAWTPAISQAHYQAATRQIKRYIAQGLTYQVNFSFRLRSAFMADPWSFFLQLMQAQESHYGAFVNLPDWAICCASPELFFRLDDRTLHCRPMKGTAPRGLTYADDRRLAEDLRHSPKNQAENVMIVDMLRHDMGRIAATGSVQVTQLFDLEQYPTLWQLTSPIQCTTDASWAEVMRALFPCASITGAPKPRTMQIIAELESSPRQIYTGTIGFLAPERRAQFNVAIRTVLIDKTKQTAEYGVGGGVVWDSTEAGEFEECAIKAKVLTQNQPCFDLLESLLWKPASGFFLLDLHLQRLQQSAAYFAFVLDLDAVCDRLRSIAATLTPEPHKIRLCVSKQGTIRLEAMPLPIQAASPLRVCLAPAPIDASNVFLYHKTTHRGLYDQTLQACPGYDDVLLWNHRGELTESCIANLIIEQEGNWYTPPLSCGLLAGTFRSWLLQQGKVQERILHIEALQPGCRLFLINSVRQIQEAIVDAPEGWSIQSPTPSKAL